MQESSPERVTLRIPALDGVRGAAAAVVVLHHSLLTVPALAAPYFGVQAAGRTDGVAWWLTYTPLHLFWDGTAAVYVFFVLSGIVLTLPVLHRGPEFAWGSYYVQRLLRLYLPVWAAVGLAVINIGLIHRVPHPSAWLSANVDPISAGALVNDLGLLTDHGYLASPLWSLHWEVVFSLLLPLFVWVAIRLGRRSIALLPLALLGVIAGHASAIPQVKFLPMFLIGTILALMIQRRPDSKHSAAWTIAGWSGLALFSAPWIIRPIASGVAADGLGQAAAVVGGTGVLLAAVYSGSFRRFFNRRPVQFLGRISFSWYLVHEPIVIGVAYLLGGSRPFIAIPVAIVLSIGLALVFHRLVEKPSHRLARAAGRKPFTSTIPQPIIERSA